MTSPLVDEGWQRREIEDIKRQLRELAPSIASSFGSTVAELQAQQADILALLDAVVVPVGGKASASSATVDGWTGGMTDRLTVTLAKPSGYTEAVVVGTGALGVLSSVPGAAIARVTIEGSSGYSTILPTLRATTGTEDFSSGTVSNVRSLTGLTGDVTVTLDVNMTGISHTSDPTMDPYQGAQLTAIALFSK